MDDAPPARPSLMRFFIEAFAANLRPALLLWVCGMVVIVGYFYVPTIHEALSRVAAVKARYGLFFSIPSTAFFAGLLPFLMQGLQRGRKANRSAAYLVFLLVFWAEKGIEVDLLYRLQAAMFGDNNHAWTIVKKVFVDQGVYVPLWAVPSMVIGYRWAEYRFRFAAVRAIFVGRWYRHHMVPLLAANLLVWLPAVVLIYLLPLPLQLPVQNLIACLWAMIVIFIMRPPTVGTAVSTEDDRAQCDEPIPPTVL